MGYSNSTIIGPYMVLTEIPFGEKEKKEIKTSCTNDSCPKYEHNIQSDCVSFCAYCGSKVEKREIVTIVKEKLNFDDVSYDFGDEDIFFQPEYMDIYLPNGFNLEVHEDSVRDIPNIEDEISEFLDQEEYKSFLSYITNLGFKYEIKVGVINYNS